MVVGCFRIKNYIKKFIVESCGDPPDAIVAPGGLGVSRDGSSTGTTLRRERLAREPARQLGGGGVRGVESAQLHPVGDAVVAVVRLRHVPVRVDDRADFVHAVGHAGVNRLLADDEHLVREVPDVLVGPLRVDAVVVVLHTARDAAGREAPRRVVQQRAVALLAEAGEKRAGRAEAVLLARDHRRTVGVAGSIDTVHAGGREGLQVVMGMRAMEVHLADELDVVGPAVDPLDALVRVDVLRRGAHRLVVPEVQRTPAGVDRRLAEAQAERGILFDNLALVEAARARLRRVDPEEGDRLGEAERRAGRQRLQVRQQLRRTALQVLLDLDDPTELDLGRVGLARQRVVRDDDLVGAVDGPIQEHRLRSADLRIGRLHDPAVLADVQRERVVGLQRLVGTEPLDGDLDGARVLLPDLLGQVDLQGEGDAAAIGALGQVDRRRGARDGSFELLEVGLFVDGDGVARLHRTGTCLCDTAEGTSRHDSASNHNGRITQPPCQDSHVRLSAL